LPTSSFFSSAGNLKAQLCPSNLIWVSIVFFLTQYLFGLLVTFTNVNSQSMCIHPLGSGKLCNMRGILLQSLLGVSDYAVSPGKILNGQARGKTGSTAGG
jgi:hypothetical protein